MSHAAMLLLLLLALLGTEAATMEEMVQDTVIRLGWAGTTSMRITNLVAKKVIEERLNRKVEFYEASPPDAPKLMGENKIDAYLELWEAKKPEHSFIVHSPHVAYVGSVGVEGRNGWFIPDYLYDFDPSFGYWQGLRLQYNMRLLDPSYTGNLTEETPFNERLSSLTSQLGNMSEADAGYAEAVEELERLVLDLQGKPTGTDYRGVLHTVAPEVMWLLPDALLIERLGLALDQNPIPMPIEENLQSNIRELYAQRRPFLSFFYNPHGLHDPSSGVRLVRVQLLDWKESCNIDGGDLECQYTPDNLQKLLGTNLQAKAPRVFEFLKNLQFNSSKQTNDIWAAYMFKNKTLEESVDEFYYAHLDYFTQIAPDVQEVYVRYNSGLGIFILALFCLFSLLSLLIGAFVIYHYNHPVFIAATRGFCVVMIVGSLVGYTAVFTFYEMPTTAMCILRPLLMATSFGMIFPPLLLKTFRIWRIFSNPHVDSSWMSNRNFGYIMCAFLLVQTIPLIVWYAVSPPLPTLIETLTTRTHVCQSENTELEFGITLYLVISNGVLVFLGGLLAFETRRVSSQFKESKYIGAAIYHVIVIGIVAISLLSYSKATFELKFVVRAMAVLIIPSFTILTLFVPKVFYVFGISRATTSDLENSSVKKGNPRANSPTPRKSADSPDARSLNPPKRSETPKSIVVPPVPEVELLDRSLESMRRGEYEAGY